METNYHHLLKLVALMSFPSIGQLLCFIVDNGDESSYYTEDVNIVLYIQSDIKCLS